MNELTKYVAGAECVELTAKQLRILARPGVYVFLTAENTALYVGSSTAFLKRISHTDHPCADAASSSVIFLPCKSIQDARKLEQRLIFDLKPVLNQRGGASVLAESLGVSLSRAGDLRKSLSH
jgi:hypothetical protein